MKINLQHWDKKHIVGFVIALLFVLFFLFASIGLMTTGDVKGGFVLLLFFEILPVMSIYAIASPRQCRCMQAVKDTMTYAALKKRIESEWFDEPYQLWDGGADKYRRYLLFSKEWIIIAWEGILHDPVCIPISDVKEVWILTGILRGTGYIPGYDKYVLRFHTDNRKVFLAGFIRPNDIEKVASVLNDRFPRIPVRMAQ